MRIAIADGRFRCRGADECFNVEELCSGAPESVEWRVIDHCSAVTRIYAIFEQFAEEMIKEYIGSAEKMFKYTELAEALQINYRLGIGRLLEKHGSARYENIVLEAVISDYQKALSGGETYRLEPVAMLGRDQNLRLPELERLFSRCGLGGLIPWVHGHPDVRTFFSQESRISSTAEAELGRLVQYRNDAAHGALAVDDVVGVDILCEFADFIRVMSGTLAARVQHEILMNAETKGLAESYGKITEVYRGGTVVVAPLVGKLRVGQKMYLADRADCVERTILSIQLGGADQQEFSTDEPMEIGLGLDGQARKGARVMVMVPPEL